MGVEFKLPSALESRLKLLWLSEEELKENIEKYVAVKKTMENLRANLTLDAIAKLQGAGYDLDNMSVWEIESAMNDISKNDTTSLETEVFKAYMSKDMSYDEARKLAKEIYGVDIGDRLID